MKLLKSCLVKLLGNYSILKYCLILVLGLALFLRLYKPFSIPPSLNWDEVSHGYNAYSILKTGRDEWGIKFPLIFRCYGDYKLPLYIYLTSFSVAIFGLNAFSVRFISILSGVGLVLISYLITKEITENKKISLVAALLASVSPWGLFLSRVAVEANLGAFLFSTGVYFLFKWIKKNEKKNLCFITLFWGFSLFTYNSARILVPISFLIVILLVIKKRQVRQLILPGIIIVPFLLLFFGQLLDKSASARYDWVSLIDQGTVNNIIEQRSKSKLPGVLSRLLYNRFSYFSFYTAKNYLNNLSPIYLFFRGGSHYQFSLPGHELLYLVTAPFLLLGILSSLRKRPKLIILGWFFIAFIPSAITKDAPHVLRSILVLPTPMILTALGLQWTINKIDYRSLFKGQLLIWVLMLVVFISFYRWWSDYQNIYPKAYSWAWQYGYEQAVSFISENYQKYDKIFLTKRYGEPHEFLLFYLKYDPEKYQNDLNKKWDYHANWYWIDGFDKFQFINDWEVVDKFKVQSSKFKVLLITSPGNYPDGWNKIKTINFLDGKPAFEILER